MNVIFSRDYEKQIFSQNDIFAQSVAGQVQDFADLSYRMTEQLAKSPSVVSMATDIKLDSLQQLVLAVTDEKTGRFTFVIDGEGVVVAHPDNTYLQEL